MSSGTGFFGSPIYKKVMSKVYGIGAAVAIMGALFKIQHLPGASIALTAGLGVEALIFFLSAFEPPHEMPDWSLVYPELVGLESDEKSLIEPQTSKGAEMYSISQGEQLEPGAIAKLGVGINSFAQTIDQLSEINDIGKATSAYLASLNTATGSFNNLADVQTKTTQEIQQSSEALTESYAIAAKAVAEEGVKVGGVLSKSGENVIETIQMSGKQLTDIYTAVGQAINGQMTKLSEVQDKTTQDILQSSDALCESYSSAAKSVADGGMKVADAMTKTGENVVETLQTSGKQLNDSYQTIGKAIENQFEQISDIQTRTSQDIRQSSEALSESYATAAKAVTDEGMKVAEALSKSGGNVVEAVQLSGKQLTDVYKSMEQSMSEQIQQISVGANMYNDNIQAANSNLSAINSVYELHLASINNQVNEVNKLAITLGELNTIYGNMLSVMNVGK